MNYSHVWKPGHTQSNLRSTNVCTQSGHMYRTSLMYMCYGVCVMLSDAQLRDKAIAIARDVVPATETPAVVGPGR